ncbi:zinc finger protein [Penicillium herquei]|nr:zinc finger protein [Penicillium herquei]
MGLVPLLLSEPSEPVICALSKAPTVRPGMPTTDSLEDEWTRRNKAVAAGIQYCGFQEGGPLRGRRKRSAPSDDDDVVPSPPARKIKTDTSPEERHTAGGKPIPNVELTLACFQCPKAYADYNGVRRHFRDSHLMDRRCNFCDLSVLHEMHLRRHAGEDHGLRT